MEQSVFEFVADILPGLVPDELGDVRLSAHRYGIKVWFGSEHTKEQDNEAVLAHLLASEKRWRKSVGDEPAAGAFLGRAEHWRRVSETWADPDLSDADLAFEIAARLTDYVTALEPALRSRATR